MAIKGTTEAISQNSHMPTGDAPLANENLSICEEKRTNNFVRQAGRAGSLAAGLSCAALVLPSIEADRSFDGSQSAALSSLPNLGLAGPVEAEAQPVEPPQISFEQLVWGVKVVLNSSCRLRRAFELDRLPDYYGDKGNCSSTVDIWGCKVGPLPRTRNSPPFRRWQGYCPGEFKLKYMLSDPVEGYIITTCKSPRIVVQLEPIKVRDTYPPKYRFVPAPNFLKSRPPRCVTKDQRGNIIPPY